MGYSVNAVWHSAGTRSGRLGQNKSVADILKNLAVVDDLVGSHREVKVQTEE